MSRRFLAVCALLATAAVHPFGSRAEGPSAPPLALGRALDLALERNETPRIAAQRVVQARAARRAAYAMLLPTLAVSGTYTRRNQEVSRDMSGETVVLQSENGLASDATAELELLDPQAFPLIKAAGSEIHAAELALADSRRTLCFDVAESYYAVLSAERLVAAAERRVELSQGVLANVQARVASGLAGVNDATRSELELESAKLAVTNARSAVKTTRLALGYLIGEEVTAPLAEPVIEFRPDAGAAELERQALGARIDLKAEQATAEAARQRSWEPWMRLVPSLRILASWRATNEPGFSDTATDWDVAATLTWVLYDGGLRYADARRLAADYEITTLETNALSRRIGFEIRTALTALETADAALVQAKARLAVAEKNAAEVRERFLRGLATALEQADAAVAEFEAQAEVERQRLAGRVATLSLLSALGRWPEEKPR